MRTLAASEVGVGPVVAAAGSRVAERVAWFYAVHPRGRIITDLVTRAREVAVFRAAVYRDPADALPAATGWSSGNPAGGSALERVEEAAVGRALANLGFAAPSRAEGAAGARMLPPPAGIDGTAEALTAVPTEVPNAERAGAAGAGDHGAGVLDPEHRLLVDDLAALVTRAERYGLRARRAAGWRARLRAGADAPAVLREAEQRLRAWVERRRAEPYAGAV